MSELFYIGDWQVQPQAGLISREGETRRLEPKVMAVLEVLTGAQGEAVTRHKIMDMVWPNQEVSDDMLTSTISSLRRALGDDRKENRYIETIPKRGYRVVVEVRSGGPLPSATATTSTHSGASKAKAKTSALMYWSLLVFSVLMSFAIWLWMTKETSPPLVEPDDQSIAVLPLDVFSDDPEMVHFTSGLEEELIHQLASQPDLRVIARTSSFQFRDQSHGIREISKILGVRHVIEGSVRDSSNGVRITIQLIDAKTDSHLWTQVFDVERDRLVAVQEEVGVAVSRMISGQQAITQTATQPRHPVPDAAYRLFLLGEAHMRVGTAASYRKASDYFSDAIRISPDYALAYSRLAAAYMLLYQYDGDPLELAASQARKALDKALELDPNQPEALATMGLMYTYTKEYVSAETYFKAALERQDNLRFALHNYGFMLWSESRFAEALVPLKKALNIDPLSGVSNFLVGDALVGMRELDEAREHFEACRSLLPEYYACQGGLAALQLLALELDEAEATLLRAGKLVQKDDFWYLVGRANLALLRNDFATATGLLDRASPKNPRNYVLLRLKLLNSIATQTLPVFMAELQEMLLNNPSDRDVRLISALSFYFSGACPEAIAIYEEEMMGVDAFLVDAWDLGFGLTHAASLAYCLKVAGNTEAMDKPLMAISDQLSRPSSPLMAGGLYLFAKHAYLLQEPEEAKKYMLKLEGENWPLSWLAAHDPILQDLR